MLSQHNFVNPTAFAQDAVHPFEGVIQGPLGHYFASLCFPMHPVAHAAFGFFTSCYAIAAHDGRAYDLADHTVHVSRPFHNASRLECLRLFTSLRLPRQPYATAQ